VAESPVSVVGNDLVIIGTPGADTIYLWSSGAANQVAAWVNGETFGRFVLPDGGRVVVHAGDGNDQVFASDLYVGMAAFGEAGHDLIVGSQVNDVLDGGNGVDRLWGGLGDDLIRGGDGDDYLFGREGNDILVGGAGNDTLDGFDGRDLLIGGLGTDVPRGGGDDDILIGGTTTYDDDSAALAAIHSVWLAPGDGATRIATLSQPGGWLAPGAVADDGDADALVGDAGDDWLLGGAGDWLYQ
jgi:Ca2+-binding RTX toxin-like protein